MQTHAFLVAETDGEDGLHFQARACLQGLEGLGREDDVIQVLCKKGEKSDIAKRKIRLLDLGASEVPEVTNEVPNSAEELGSRLVVAVEQLLQTLP